MKLKISEIDPSAWHSLDANVPMPLQQYYAYGHTIEAMGGDAFQMNICDQHGEMIGLALCLKRKLYGLIRFNVLLRGPLWSPGKDTAENRTAFYQALKTLFPKYRWRFMALLPEFNADDSDKIAALRQSGFRRVMTGFSTAWLDLRPDTDTLRQSLKAKWRNQLKKAESGRMEMSVGGRKPHSYTWLLEKESEQRSTQRYQAMPLGLVPAYSATSDDPSDRVLSVSAIHDREKVAGALFLLHGNSATYHIGWTGKAGRALNAQNRVLWHAMLALKERDIAFLDFGGINTADLAGITRFKLGTGATPIILAGAYL